ncbi:hypothetical protein ACFFX1_10160 [Dactylosporangium sucinum]|uniref:Uncharacterized protein n=1 Tax=Dactylosporangium sucinum TaxID=1424081 RepID=A0A917TJ11_9ACTN|nr:hypothetical protein [Dactylosporangium sucinum]GGM24124.1 hypothetical protein GCM10007977_026610 [Dactylosporangium sucinum]
MTDQFQPAYVPHDDPFGEARDRWLQGLSVLATLGEAGARMAAVEIQNRAATREWQARQDEAAAAARREADALTAKVRGERQRMADSLDEDWLINHASFSEAAWVWRTATVYATGDDPLAGRAANLAEDRLRKLHPDLMAAYDRLRQPGPHGPGLSKAEAMREAAYEVWQNAAGNDRAPGPQARPHGNTWPRPEVTNYDEATAGLRARRSDQAALPVGGWQVLDELDRQVRLEVAELAEYVSLEALEDLQRSWRSLGKLPPADPTALLRAHLNEAVGRGHLQPVVAEGIISNLEAQAAVERANGRRAGGAADDPRTGVDEHTAGQVASVVSDDRADQTATTAAAMRHSEPATAPPSAARTGEPSHRAAQPVVAQGFPGPLRVRAAHPSAASRQPTQPTITPVQGRAR